MAVVRETASSQSCKYMRDIKKNERYSMWA